MENIKIALDWTPNTNHTGFYVAQALGYYEEMGLFVELITPDTDNYQRSPAKRLEVGEVDLALCPTESVISYRTKPSPADHIGIAALLRQDISAIAVLADRGIDRPSHLDGKSYASYKARYEDEIVRQMVINDGGKGDIRCAYPDRLGIWSTLIDQQYDATWIFLNWEGFDRKAKEISLKYFKLEDYHIPYSYSPLLTASEKKLKARKDVYRQFLQMTKKGYLYAKANPMDAAAILKSHLAANDDEVDLVGSQQFTADYYGNEDDWGRIDKNVVQQFLDWIAERGMEKSLKAEDIIANPLR